MTTRCSTGRRAALAAGAALLAATMPASGHVTVQPGEAVAGSYVRAALAVTHGCNGSPTVALKVEIPEGVMSAKPQMKPGWQAEVHKRALTTPLPGPHGKPITEVVDEVSWHGGPLPDSLFDTFGLLLKLPDKPGTTLYLPTVQTCEQGEMDWAETPAGADGHLQRPAPAIRLKAKLETGTGAPAETGMHSH